MSLDIHNPHFTSAIFAQACQHYNIDSKRAKTLKANSNLVFDCGEYVLRLTPATARPATDIGQELAWMRHLALQQVPVVEVIRSTTGNLLENVGEGDGAFTVVCLEKIKGQVIKAEQWNADHFRRLGRITAATHLANDHASMLYQASVVKNWDGIFEHDCCRYLPQDQRQLPQILEKVLAIINEQARDHDYGIVHYDIHHGNYLMSDDNHHGLILFDFEMLCRCWYLMDVSVVFYYANVSSHQKLAEADFLPHFLTPFWLGYNELKPAPAFDEYMFQVYLLYRDLMILGFLEVVWAGKQRSAGERAFVDRLNRSLAYHRSVVS